MTDLIECQGPPQDIGGYYKPDPVKAAAVSHRARRQRQSVDYSTPAEQAVGSRLKCRLAVIGGKAVALIQK